MATTTVDLAEWKDFKRSLEKFAHSDQQKIVRRGAEQVGLTFDDYVKDRLPPTVRKLKVAKYWTDKQRKWWWATMRAKADGRSNALPGWTARWRKVKGRKTLVISGHYKRTGLLVRSLDFEIDQDATATTVQYGTKIRYAKWVIDLNGPQSKYHKGNWDTLQSLANQASPLLRKVFADAVNAEVNRYFGG